MSGDELAGGGWMAIAVAAVLALGKFVALFARLVAAVVELLTHARLWFAEEAKVRLSTLEHHARVKQSIEEQSGDDTEVIVLHVGKAAEA